MDCLPEIKMVNEEKEDIKEEEIDKTSVDEDIHQDTSLEIEVPEESKIFEKTPEKPPKRGRGRPKKVEVRVEPPSEDDEVELDVEEDIEDIPIPQLKPKQARSYRDLVWLNEVFCAGKDSNWISSKRIKMLLEKYGKEYGNLTYSRFCKWAKYRYSSVPKKQGQVAGLSRINIATQKDLMYVLSLEGEEFGIPPQKKEQPKTFDFNDFKSYMDEYEREKESKRKQEEIDRLKKEKEELEMEQRYFAKFQRQQMMQRQKATSSLPPQQNHIDWSQYRGI